MAQTFAYTQTNKKRNDITYDAIVNEIRAGKISPVYLLMGEESYYIDHLSDFIVTSVLQPEERDFNLVTYFGAETDVDTVINAAKSFPMGASHQVVVVKEAQRLAKFERLEYYLKKVQPTTILVLCYMGGKIDRRTKVASQLEKVGTIFESKKLYDNQLVPFVTAYLRRRKVGIRPEAAGMLVDYIGSDLNRMASELDKLCIALPPAETTITPDFVASHVGVSRDFNVFELQEALGVKNIFKVMQIANYFCKNPKANSPQKVLPMLFKYFTNIMLAYYAPDKSDHGIAVWLGQTDWQVRRNVVPAMKQYTATKVMKILGELRRTDARSKGIDNPNTSPEELMRELFYFILH